MRDEIITSVKNPRVRAVQALMTEARERRETGRFGVEGAREIARAVRGGFVPELVVRCSELASDASRAALALPALAAAPQLPVSREVFAKLAMREGVDGLVVVFVARTRTLEDVWAQLPAGRAPLVVAVDGVEKPGNVGALARSADGAGADALVVLAETADVFGPQTVRASLGTVLALPVVVVAPEVFLAFCRARGVRVSAAMLAADARPYDGESFVGATALVLGSEAHGVGALWSTAADARIIIPMHGVADSLNVAAAGAVLLYEAARQRRASAQLA